MSASPQCVRVRNVSLSRLVLLFRAALDLAAGALPFHQSQKERGSRSEELTW